jgi:hypothetical protein
LVKYQAEGLEFDVEPGEYSLTQEDWQMPRPGVGPMRRVSRAWRANAILLGDGVF